jgi:peptidyl-prolyl cis-trans isomerase A (cyclophilin A)
MKMKLKWYAWAIALTTASVFAQAKKAAAPDGLLAEIETTKGKIVLQLEYEKTPVTVANFVSLAEGNNPMVAEKFKGKRFYDGLKFHRVIADFMIQGGDPNGNGSGDPGYKFKDEITALKHTGPGILSMANSGPATNGSQFFITHKETAWLDGKHTVFGHVVTGQDVVNAIAQDDLINKVTIVRRGNAAKAFDAPKIFENYFAEKANEEKRKAEADRARNEAKMQYLNSIRKEATVLPNGTAYKITHKAEGVRPANGTTVYIHYAGYLENGSLFDSSLEEVNKEYGKLDAARAAQKAYRPFPYELGKQEGLIRGFIDGLEQMKPGDKAVVFIPAENGYGARGAGNVIPPNSNIIFEIQMLDKMP